MVAQHLFYQILIVKVIDLERYTFSLRNLQDLPLVNSNKNWQFQSNKSSNITLIYFSTFLFDKKSVFFPCLIIPNQYSLLLNTNELTQRIFFELL